MARVDEAADGVGDRIGGFQESAPGALVVKSSGVDQHNGLARYSWDIVDPNGNTVMVGIDVAEHDPDGRLRRVVMFFGPLAGGSLGRPGDGSTEAMPGGATPLRSIALEGCCLSWCAPVSSAPDPAA